LIANLGDLHFINQAISGLRQIPTERPTHHLE
jgi:hypothetical protein